MTLDREGRLMNCKTLSEFLTMFFGLSKHEKEGIFTEKVLIQKGTEFYRIRRVEGFDNPDFNDTKEWGPVPKEKAKQGRFNRKGESVLYVASDSSYLGREVRLQEGEEYYLAKYECKKAFYVGTFLSTDNLVNTLIHKIAMSVSSRDELTADENGLIEEYLKLVQRKSLADLAIDVLSSLFMHRYITSFYDVTNRLGQLVFANNECGIRYSSVYVPFELSGGPQMITLDGLNYGNYVLSEKGCQNIELKSVSKKVYHPSNDLSSLIEIAIEMEQEKSY